MSTGAGRQALDAVRTLGLSPRTAAARYAVSVATIHGVAHCLDGEECSGRGCRVRPRKADLKQ